MLVAVNFDGFRFVLKDYLPFCLLSDLIQYLISAIIESLCFNLRELDYLRDEDALYFFRGAKEHLFIAAADLYLKHLHVDLVFIGVGALVVHVEDVPARSLLKVDLIDVGLVITEYHGGDSADVHRVPESSVDLIAADNVFAVIDPV
jgi:hypothetical protein